MPDLDELDLRGEPEPTPPEPEPPRDAEPGFRLAALGVAAAALVVGAGLWFFLRSPPPPTASPSAAPPAPSAPTPIPGPEAFGLPALDQSDAFLRDAAKGLTSHPLLGLWLGQQGIVRLVANVVDTVAKGDSPRASLGFLAPKGAFAVSKGSKQTVVDATSYARYDFFAEGVASLDAAAAARIYRRALPLFEAAYRELGYPQGGFDAALREATGALLAVPVVQGELAVKPVRHGTVVVYECVDPALEALSPAQKHLLRMGPANVQRVQGALRAFLAALVA